MGKRFTLKPPAVRTEPAPTPPAPPTPTPTSPTPAPSPGNRIGSTPVTPEHKHEGGRS